LILTSPSCIKFSEDILPDKKFSKVVFPAPDGPIMLKNYPGLT